MSFTVMTHRHLVAHIGTYVGNEHAPLFFRFLMHIFLFHNVDPPTVSETESDDTYPQPSLLNGRHTPPRHDDLNGDYRTI